MGEDRLIKRQRLLPVTAPLLPLVGCAPRPPAFAAAGAFFPAWLACALLGILGAVVIRLLFIRLGLDDALPLRLIVYIALALGIAFALSLFVFGR